MGHKRRYLIALTFIAVLFSACRQTQGDFTLADDKLVSDILRLDRPGYVQIINQTTTFYIPADSIKKYLNERLYTEEYDPSELIEKCIKANRISVQLTLASDFDKGFVIDTMAERSSRFDSNPTNKHTINQYKIASYGRISRVVIDKKHNIGLYYREAISSFASVAGFTLFKINGNDIVTIAYVPTKIS